MTNKELNRDIKRLWNEYEFISYQDQNEYFAKVESKIKPEFERLYRADDSFTALNLQSIKIMMRLNLRLRVIPLHLFGINIKI